MRKSQNFNRVAGLLWMGSERDREEISVRIQLFSSWLFAKSSFKIIMCGKNDFVFL